jgi:DNA mismatch repair protein MutL
VGKIILLDELTANKIAAGEVIERPASVVKELVENSIDAGSSHIQIDVVQGGISKIKITDNGLGMDAEDASYAFQRHATSKIKDAEDLFNINSLGFRGEALPSIASVARVVLITREKASLEGTRVEIAGGKIQEISTVGSPPGTSFEVTDLFFNTPARKKYLKTENTEFGHISDLITRMALGNPNISFILRNNGKQFFRTPGTGKLQDVISTVYGLEIARQMIELTGENEILSLKGLIAKPEINRANRQQQSFFINGRYIKSKIIGYALEEGYHTLLPIGRYPLAVLHVEINPAMVDVNVHPTKMEVRFSKEKEIITSLSQWVKETFSRQKLIPGLEDKQDLPKAFLGGNRTPRDPKAQQNQIFGHDLFNQTSDKQTNPNLVKKVVEDLQTSGLDKDFGANSAFLANEVNIMIEENQGIVTEANQDIVIDKHQVVHKEITVNDYSDYKVEEAPSPKNQQVQEARQAYSDNLPYMKPLAQIDKTYIIAQGIDGMFIIDQHAAHERVLYERYMNQELQHKLVVQTLLVPITLELTPRETSVLVNNILILNELGFVIEHFGGNTFLIREVPQELSKVGEETFFRDLLDCLTEEIGSINQQKLREKLIITMACKAAIKANQSLTIGEMEELLNLLANAVVPYTCPHGRPTIIHFSTYELEKKFKRVQ